MVFLGCHNKIPHTRHFTVLEARVQDQMYDLILIRASFWLVGVSAFSLCPHINKSDNSGASSFSFKGTNPTTGGSTLKTTSKPNYLPEAPSQYH